MKQLFTLALAFACLSAHSQSGVMPYNPDSNGDALIGSEDLISILGVYNTLMIDSSLTCDYQGTELETLIGGIMAGNFVLDSVYVEYLLIDSVVTYSPECPDPFVVEVVLDRSYMITQIIDQLQSASPLIRAYSPYLGYTRQIWIWYQPDSGGFRIQFWEEEIGAFFPFDQYDNWISNAPDCCSYWATLPFPENWTLDEDGIQVDWNPYGWVANCEHFRLIPFWHEAE